MQSLSITSLHPRNRRLLISVIKEEEESTDLVLPEEYTRLNKRHCVAKIIDHSPDCSLNFAYTKGLHVVLESQMIEEISIAGQVFEMVLENYVLGVLELE